jgi:hypothetical protein
MARFARHYVGFIINWFGAWCAPYDFQKTLPSSQTTHPAKTRKPPLK